MINLIFLFFGLSTAHANINEIFAEALSGRPDRGGVKSSYELRQYETKEIKHSEEMYGIRQHRFDLIVPLQQLTDKKWKLHFSGFHQEIRSNFLFPNRKAMPNSLWNVGTGVTHSRLTDKNHTVATGFFIGSNSDRPFSRSRDLVAQANFLYKVPTEGENAWLFFVSFSNDRGFLNYVPLPGAAYFFRAHEKLRMALGVPFLFLFWTPFEKAIFNLSYFPLYNAQAKFSYYLFGPAHIYLQTKFQGDLSRLSDRTNSRERFIQEELQSALGFVMPLEKSLMMEANGGFSWDRRAFWGENSQDRKLGQIARPGKAPFATLKFMANF